MQEMFKAIVLKSMEEHWGPIDDGLNPDLDDIADAYRTDVVLAAVEAGQIIGTAIAVLAPSEAKVVRMAVRRDRRRHGIATRLLNSLTTEVRGRGVERMFLETSADWTDARSFCEAAGFRFTHRALGDFGWDAHYQLDLTSWFDHESTAPT